MPELFTITGPLGSDNPFVFHSLRGTEELSRLFEFEVEVLSRQRNISLNDVLGQGVTIRIPTRPDGERFLHGFVARCQQVEHPELGIVYHLSLRPWLWFLSRTTDCRIFQAQTTREIMEAIFRDQGFTDFRFSLQGTYVAWEYCVQYRESCFDFVSRLMEHEGIYYYFEHESGKHKLVFCDDASAHSPVEGTSTIPFYPPSTNVIRDEFVAEWELRSEIQSTKVVLADYNFTTPLVKLEPRLSMTVSHVQGSGAVFDYPGGFGNSTDGSALTKTRLEALAVQQQWKTLRSDARRLGAGWRFTLSNHPREDQNAEYLIVSSRYEIAAYIGEAGGDVDLDFIGTHDVIPVLTPFRPQRITRKPTVAGPQTAVVVGQAGQEVDTDVYGRVKVQFHWDRLGQKDQNSSCWIRVSQAWAGNKWGAHFIPRIGQEVIVDFLEGDPDRPIITGSVYNAQQAVPYTLPDDASKSGIKTRSFPEGTGETYNELRFNDKKGEEEVYFHAERDFLRIVENNDVLKVGFEVKDAGDQSIVIFNNQTVTIGNKDGADGTQQVTVWKDQKVTIGGNQTLKIGYGGDGSGKDGGRSIQIAKNHAVVIGNDETVEIKTNRAVTIQEGNDTLTISKGNQKISVDAGTSTLEAAKEILLKVGSNSIKIDSDGITLDAMKIVLKASTNIEMEAAAKMIAKSPLIDVLADGVLTLKGGVVKIN